MKIKKVNQYPVKVATWTEGTELSIMTTGQSSITVVVNGNPNNKLGFSLLESVRKYIYDLLTSGKPVIDFDPIYKTLKEQPAEVLVVTHNVWNSKPTKQNYRYVRVMGDHNGVQEENLYKVEYPVKTSSYHMWHSNNRLSLGGRIKRAGITNQAIGFGGLVNPTSIQGGLETRERRLKKELKEKLDLMLQNTPIVDLNPIILELVNDIEHQFTKPSTTHW